LRRSVAFSPVVEFGPLQLTRPASLLGTLPRTAYIWLACS
jgi:hypothetical protein